VNNHESHNNGNLIHGSILREKARKNLWQFGTSRTKMQNKDGPLVFHHAEGNWLFDADGKSYFDALSGVWVVNAGHGQKRIADAMARQAQEMGYVLSEEGFANIRAIELSELLLRTFPSGFERVYFTCGGSEAVEIALRTARVYQRLQNKPRKNRFISRRGSYHGATLLTLSMNGNELLSHAAGPPPPGLIKVAHPYCYRCEFSHYDERVCNIDCALDLEEAIVREGPDNVAAFIAEPISTAAGVAVPPKKYWREIRRICDKYDVLLILDEIVTGFGRLGAMFAMEYYDILPDIVVVAKALTSGYSPLGAMVTSRKITSGIPDRAFLIPGYTYSGHPVSCVAAMENLSILIEDDLVHNAQERGRQLKALLREKLGDHPLVGDIRGVGLLLCIEIVRDKHKRTPFSYEDGITDMLSEYFLSRRVYIRLIEGYIHLGPPLTVTDSEIIWLAELVADALGYLSCQLQIK